MIFDTHAHYDDDAFDEDRESLLSSLPENGIGGVVNVGASLSSCRQTLALLEQYPFFYGAIGVHPSETAELTEESFAWLRTAAKTARVVAVGEIGLDYYWEEPDHKTQKEWFHRQLALAGELGLPVIIHSRDAASDTLQILKEHQAEQLGGVIHCYSYSLALAKEYEKMGFYFGIGGVVTFKNARKLAEVVTYLPLDRIVLETDAPYLAPVPLRGSRNSSVNLPYIAQRIAELKDVSYEEVIKRTCENAKKLYHLNGAEYARSYNNAD